MNKTFLILLLIPLLLLGCRGTKEAAQRAQAEELKALELYKNALENEFKYEYLSAKIKFEYIKDGNNTSAKADLRMKRDSIIWMSVTPGLGLEVARVLITKDSIKILDRLNKVYYNKPFSYINTNFQLPVNFEMLQDIIAGGLVIFNEEKMTSDVEGKLHVLTTDDGRLNNKSYFEAQTYLLAQMIVNDIQENRKVNLLYTDYAPLEGQQFSMKRSIKLESPDNMEVNLEFERIIISDVLNFPFVVSDKYEEVK